MIVVLAEYLVLQFWGEFTFLRFWRKMYFTVLAENVI